MIEYENGCVDCPREIGCIGDSCPYKRIPHYYCDECGTEDTLFEYDAQHLCKDCLLDKFDKVEGSEL